MALTTSPAYPVTGEAITLTSSLDTGMAATHVAIEITSVPSASNLSTGFLFVDTDETALSSVAAAQTGKLASSFTADVPGEYGVTVYLIWRLPPVTPGQTEARWRVKATDTGTIHVGQFVELTVRTQSLGGATLRCRVNDDTIRAASFVDFDGEKARAAALQSTVVAAVEALEGVTVDTVIGDSDTRANDLATKFAAHRVGTSWHSAADAENVVTSYPAHSPMTLVARYNELYDRILAHMTELTTGSRFHTADDTKNTPITGHATDLAGVLVGLSDLRERVYERHREQGSADTPAVHTIAAGDTTNALTAPTPLDDVLVAFLDALADQAPTAPSGEVDGAIRAAAAGFRIVP